MPNFGGAEADLQICLSFLAAKGKRETERVTQFSSVQEKPAGAWVRQSFLTACWRKVLGWEAPDDVIPIAEGYSTQDMLTSPQKKEGTCIPSILAQVCKGS